MQIDLHNFFKHYDEKNPKHVAAVEQLEKDLLAKSSDLMQDDANWVRIFRTKIEAPKTPGILQVIMHGNGEMLCLLCWILLLIQQMDVILGSVH